MTKSSEVKVYGVRRMDLHEWGDQCIKQSMMSGTNNCEPVVAHADFAALQTRCEAGGEGCETVPVVARWWKSNGWAHCECQF